MVTWSEVKRWNSGRLSAPLDVLIQRRRMLVEVGEDIMATEVPDWSGTAAEAAERKRQQLKEQCELLLAQVGDLIHATSAAEDGVGEVELCVNEACSMADHYSFNISDTGKVSDTLVGLMRAGLDTIEGIKDAVLSSSVGSILSNRAWGEHLHPEDAAALGLRMQVLQETQSQVDAALKKAEEVDRSYKEALDNIAKGKVSEVKDLGDSPGAAGAPPVDASTEEVASWWNSLTEEERQRMIREYHRELGNLDGIDGASRDAANRLNIAEDKERILEEMRTAKGENLEALQQRQKEIAAIEEALENAGEDGHLLLYEPATGEAGNEITHAAIAVGDIDTADHVSTYVPGMTTTVEKDMVGAVSDMQRLKQHGEQIAGNGEQVAAVAWIGYDAPPAPWEESYRGGRWDTAVASPGSAARGGESLASFQEGIFDSRRYGAGDAHMSVLGHSYGSTTSSYGMDQVRPGVIDDYAVYGSPGTLPGYDMNVPEGHMYVLKNMEDPVTLFGGGPISPLGRDPGEDPAFKSLEANKDFKLQPFEAHSTYFEEDSVALDSLSRVAVGQAG
ncbi:MAG: hypothetical protein E7Z96_09285 [Actinomycetaceae bacterium]|nr:hypothetical protein [Actinomycetaceae bacterium]